MILTFCRCRKGVVRGDCLADVLGDGPVGLTLRLIAGSFVRIHSDLGHSARCYPGPQPWFGLADHSSTDPLFFYIRTLKTTRRILKQLFSSNLLFLSGSSKLKGQTKESNLHARKDT